MRPCSVVCVTLLLTPSLVRARQPVTLPQTHCPDGSHEFCLTDTDCETGDLCFVGECNQLEQECDYFFLDPCCPTDGVCFDGDPCTEDWSCSADGRCDYPPLPEGAWCFDDDLCTVGDTCRDGLCVGTPLQCPYGSACNYRYGRCEISPSESLLVNLPLLIGLYEPGVSRSIDVSWGIPWYHMNSITVHWSGTVRYSVVDCLGVPHDRGYGGATTVSFAEPPLRAVYHDNIGQPGALRPLIGPVLFGIENVGTRLGAGATVTIEFEAYEHHCITQTPPSIVIDAVALELTGRRMFDTNGDASVDLLDFVTLSDCLDGPGKVAPAECALFDPDGDEDVDLTDLLKFQRLFRYDVP